MRWRFNFVLAEVDFWMKTKNILKYLKKICAPGMSLCHAAVQTYVSTFYSVR